MVLKPLIALIRLLPAASSFPMASFSTFLFHSQETQRAERRDFVRLGLRFLSGRACVNSRRFKAALRLEWLGQNPQNER
jgi:hypothetical protein